MPLHRQQFDGDSLLEEVPPPGGEPRLSPGRTYWWTGDEWVRAATNPAGADALAAELASPMLEPLKALPVAKVATVKKVVSVPKLLTEVLEEKPAPEPEPVVPAQQAFWSPPTVSYSSESQEQLAEEKPNRLAFLEGHDVWGIAAIAAAVLLCWMPRFGGLLALGLVVAAVAVARLKPSRIAVVAAVLAVPELVTGIVLHHNATVKADRIAADTATVEKALTNAAQFEKAAHVFNYTYAGPGGMAQVGWKQPTDVTVEFKAVHKFDYCLTATKGGITRSVHEDEIVADVPC